MNKLSPALIVVAALALVTGLVVLSQHPPTGERVRPLEGGYQIEIWKEIRFWPDDGPYTCTLGFPVYREVDGARGVVTAGHCNDWEKRGWIYE